MTLLDYGAGNVRSVRNALRALGCTVREVRSPADVASAQRLLFPGVGAFGPAMDTLKARGLEEPLKDYLREGRPFLGICLGLQLLFEGSDEGGGVEGLGVVPGRVEAFDAAALGLPVPHIGWNGLREAAAEPSGLLKDVGDRQVYFVHSFRAAPEPANSDWVLATSRYGEDFVAAVRQGDVHATQFHPEKSGDVGLGVLRNFVEGVAGPGPSAAAAGARGAPPRLTKRVIACLDVRSNDSGDLVVTKGDQYDVRDSDDGGEVRNLGKPVELCERYFKEGADEVTFLNITAFRDSPLGDLPMLEVLRRSSERVFVPLTVGGGIRGFTDAEGTAHSALDVASEYFRSGADKVSIGGDAVFAAEAWWAAGGKGTGDSSIEQISERYGAQAVVVSIDPRRVWVSEPGDTKNRTIRSAQRGPGGEEHCWFQCTVKGGREGRDLGAYELAVAVEALGAGEILLNCIDRDGAGNGFDLELVDMVTEAVGVPVIASSGAGAPEHFTEVFEKTGASAALAAGIFHRQEVEISSVKQGMQEAGLSTRSA